MKACLISDIYGAQGRGVDYMHQWSAILTERGYLVEPVFLDSLCPAAYQNPTFDKEWTHHHFVNGGAEMAARNLRSRVADAGVDLLLGFSLGGYLAALARPSLPGNACIVCISATRLRLCDAIAGDCAIHAVFGADDPWRPQTGLQVGGAQYEYLIADAGHEIYLSPAACRFVLDRLDI